MRYLGGPVTINKWLSFAGERNVKELDICFKRCTHRTRRFGTSALKDVEIEREYVWAELQTVLHFGLV